MPIKKVALTFNSDLNVGVFDLSLIPDLFDIAVPTLWVITPLAVISPLSFITNSGDNANPPSPATGMFTFPKGSVNISVSPLN